MGSAQTGSHQRGVCSSAVSAWIRNTILCSRWGNPFNMWGCRFLGEPRQKKKHARSTHAVFPVGVPLKPTNRHPQNRREPPKSSPGRSPSAEEFQEQEVSTHGLHTEARLALWETRGAAFCGGYVAPGFVPGLKVTSLDLGFLVVWFCVFFCRGLPQTIFATVPGVVKVTIESYFGSRRQAHGFAKLIQTWKIRGTLREPAMHHVDTGPARGFRLAGPPWAPTWPFWVQTAFRFACILDTSVRCLVWNMAHRCATA